MLNEKSNCNRSHGGGCWLMNDKSCSLIHVGHKSFFKEPDFHKTSGDYKVGTHLFETVDSGRSETLSPGNTGEGRF